jgi:sugar/nucleoside kinase (ribokinase family)
MNTTPSPRVGCAGLIVEDTFCGPLAEFPQEGALVSVDAMPAYAGGCAANVALDLARQGISVEIAGCVGKDAAAQNLRKCFAANGIGHDKLVASEMLPTSRTVVLLIKGQDRRYIHLFGANAALSASDLDHGWVASLDVLYIGGLFALPAMKCDELAEIFAYCRTENVKTVLDVVMPHNTRISSLQEYESLLAVTDFFLPNEDEACALTNCRRPKDQMESLLALGTGTVIITQGEKGAVAARGRDYWKCGSYSMNCVDPSGAGDAFTSGVISGILEERDMPSLLRYASAVGASATRRVGTTGSVFSAAEADQFVQAHPLDVEHAIL